MQKKANPQQASASMTREERNALVLALLEHVAILLRTSASQYHLDYEDLRQDASITIIRMLDSNEVDFSRSTAYQYVWYRVRSRIINKFCYVMRHQADSLDAPITHEEGAATLADLLPSPYQVEPSAVLIAKEHLQELSPILAERMNGSRRRAIRERWDTAAASLEMEVAQ